MITRAVCDSVPDVVKTHSSKRIHPIVVLAVTAMIYSTGLCQDGTVAGSSGMVGPGSDSLSAIFEDIYGRFPNAVIADLNYQHDETRYDNSVYPSPAYVLNQGLANFTLGNRTSYQLSGSVQASSHSYEIQDYSLGGTVRPSRSWQLSGTADYYRYGGGAPSKSMSLGLSAIHLSGGEVNLTETRLQQYYYLSNLIPDPGQLGFSFSPTFGSPIQNGISSRYYTLNVPVSLSYGLSDNIVVNGNAYYYKNSTGLSNTFRSNNWEFSGGLSLGFLFEDMSLITVGANWYTNKSFQSQLQTYGNGYQYESVTENKQTFGNISLSWDLLSLDRSISVYDLRRSYYTGHFLHASEVTNRLKVAFLTNSNDAYTPLPSRTITGRTVFSDSVTVGISDLVQLELGGNLFQSSAPLQSSEWGRYATALVTFHNLRFSGTELSDFDYFFGRIMNPGDYSVAAGGQLSSENNLPAYIFEPNSLFLVNARFGIIENLDAALNYTYTKRSTNDISSSWNSWDINIRANVLGSARLECSFGRLNTRDSLGDLTDKSNSFNVDVTLSALF